MKKLVLNHVFLTFLLTIAGLAIRSTASELQAFTSFFIPSDVTIQKEQNNVKQSNDFSSDHVLAGGIEILILSEFTPFMYGVGIGFIGSLKKDDNELLPASVPLWLSASLIHQDENWFASPYLGVRVGCPLPATTNGNWWESPLNLLASVNLGLRFPFSAGIEFSYTYVTMKKSYRDKHLYFRAHSARFGISVTAQFNISKDRTFTPNLEPVEKKVDID